MHVSFVLPLHSRPILTQLTKLIDYSGTGGAVLAIEMIAQALKKLSGAELEIEHVFSAEKEKFIRVS